MKLRMDDEVLKNLYIYNIDTTILFNTGEIVPKKCCPNCLSLTTGVNTILHE